MHTSTFILCPMSLSARLIQLRRERDWTQQDVAEQVGLHVNQIKRYEAGTAQPSLEGLKKLAVAFSRSTDWLLFEDAERGPDEDLRLQFEAVNQLNPDEKEVARAVLEGLVLKHISRKWSGTPMVAAPLAKPSPSKATVPEASAPATTRTARTAVAVTASKAAPNKTPTKRTAHIAR
jgi:transcriptional regulator with XRE-family HTH domain